MKLVIVESPSKAKKIQGYLGAGWRVIASMGHVRDLPPKEIGVDVAQGFAPTYEVAVGKGKVIAGIRAAAKEAEALYLATDPDREGEAIAWHVLESMGRTAVKGKPVFRVTFTEITKKAVQTAFAQPRQLDMALVDSQQARRVLDRLVGWRVSPVLRRAFGTNLSAGRVQSVAVRLVTEREEEIEGFKPEQSWTLEAHFQRRTPEREGFAARLAALLDRADKDLDPKRLPTERAHAIAGELSAPAIAWQVIGVETKERRRSAPPPFITSTLQQKASSTLRMKPKRAMQVAQKLYEQGLITYMRTDSPSVSAEAQQAARAVIASVFGPQTLPDKAPFFRAKGNAQEAHECVRPTDPKILPKIAKLGGEEAALYRLVWMRFIASQMKPALYDVTTGTVQPFGAEGERGRGGEGERERRSREASKSPISVSQSPRPYHFHARGSVLREAGWLTVYGVQAGTADEEEGAEEEENQVLPPLERGEAVDLQELAPAEHWTQPPPRFSEPSLIKALEKEGVGRPSTYASIMETIQARGYVEPQGKTLVPTDAGRAVTHFLVAQFPNLLDLSFTRQMEDDLDRVAEGQVAWQALMGQFYGPLEERIAAARGAKPEAALAEPCPQCGATLEQKSGRFGFYKICPSCGWKPQAATVTDKPCPLCGQPLVQRKSKKGAFLGCSAYPACSYTEPLAEEGKRKRPLDPESTAALAQPCPECGKPMVEKSGRYGPFAGCSGYPECRFIFKPTNKPARATKPKPTTARTRTKGTRSAAPTTEVASTAELAGAGAPCPKCGKPMVAKSGRYGPFVACPGYPGCKYIHKGT